MIKRKLRALRQAEEKKILAENEGLYRRLVDENYQKTVPAAERTVPAAERKRGRGWLYGVAAAMAGVLAVFVSVGFMFGRIVSDKNMAEAPDSSSNEYDVNHSVEDTPSQPGEAEAPGDNDSYGEVSIEYVESVLQSTRLYGGLKFRSIVAGKDKIEIEVDTFYTFDVVILLNEDARLDGFFPESGDVESATINDMDVSYIIDTRKKEDYYAFYTLARVDGGSEVYYITYNYTSVRSDCELTDMIGALINRK